MAIQTSGKEYFNPVVKMTELTAWVEKRVEAKDWASLENALTFAKTCVNQNKRVVAAILEGLSHKPTPPEKK
jgi:hypothetical protein